MNDRNQSQCAPVLPKDRFFYHSFPRVAFGAEESCIKPDECIGPGLVILRSVAKNGLLLTPESWRLPPELVNEGPSANPVPVFQKRICFTAIRPDELAAHAKCFGPFSLEFDIQTLRSMGAMPVIYIPTTVGSDADFGGIGVSLLHRIEEARRVLSRIESLKGEIGDKKFATPFVVGIGDPLNPSEKIQVSTLNDVIRSVEYGARDAGTIRAALDAISSFMYPTEEPDADDPNQYFQEREWRITNAFVHSSSDLGLTMELNADQKAALVDQTPSYFGSEIEMKAGSGRVVDFCLTIPGFEGRSIVEIARRIIVPSRALSKAREIFPNKLKEKLVTLEGLLKNDHSEK